MWVNFCPSRLSCSGELCEVAPPPSPCQLAQCQNGALCAEASGTAACQCQPGFQGQRCEKLVSVNFIDRDSYVQLQDVKNWPQANISLQVRRTAWRHTSHTHAHTLMGVCGSGVNSRGQRCPPLQRRQRTNRCGTPSGSR